MLVKYCPVNVSFFFVFSAHYSKSTDFVVWEFSTILQQSALTTDGKTSKDWVGKTNIKGWKQMS